MEGCHAGICDRYENNYRVIWAVDIGRAFI